MSKNPWLYAIVDVDACAQHGVDVRQHAEHCLEAGPRWLQLRAKPGTDDEHRALAMAMAALCKETSTTFVVNDRIALAHAVGATHVHLGQHDASTAEALRTSPQLLLGRSTHSRDELQAALAEAPAYVAYGPVFPTRSKQNPEPVVGRDGLRHAHSMARASAVPLVAIGGIDATNLAVVRAHADAFAFISALLPQGGEPWRAPFERLRVLVSDE